MCGIVGIIGQPDRPSAERMLVATRHRGPDDSGIFEDSYVTIGMNRLSILDTSLSGHQPMASDDQRYWIVYNGEVYNFLEIREDLRKRGHSFRSSSDTEVILKAFIEYKEKCLSLFRGMFAFVIYDSKTREIFGARDRFGIKPFYYTKSAHELVFASEIKGLFASGRVGLNLQTDAIKSICLFGSILPGQSVIQSVEAVPPGNFFWYVNGTFTMERYWNLDAVKPNSISSYSEAQELFLQQVKDSVNLSFISDRKLGVFLSGGIDSVSILAAARLLNKTNVKTFTVGFEDSTHGVYDEREESLSMAQYFGYDNEQVIVNGADFKKTFNDFVHAIDHPSFDGLNTFLISRYARQHLVVALSGLGSDELMGGYARDRAVAEWSANPAQLPQGLVKLMNYWGKRYHSTVKNIPFLAKLLNGVHSSDVVWNHFLIRQILTMDKVAGLFKSGEFSHADWLILYESFSAHKLKGSSQTKFNQLASLELNTYMTNQLLRDMDAVSMYNSMEVRFPFLDHPIAEFLFSLPDSYKVKPGANLKGHKEAKYSYQEYGSKRILLDAFQKFLPHGYLERKKRGFTLPLKTWLNEYFREEIQDTLDNRQKNQCPYFSSEGLRSLRDSCKAGEPVDSMAWIVFLFLKWEAAMKEKFQDSLR